MMSKDTREEVTAEGDKSFAWGGAKEVVGGPRLGRKNQKLTTASRGAGG